MENSKKGHILFSAFVLAGWLLLQGLSSAQILAERSIFRIQGFDGEGRPAKFSGYGAPLIADLDGDGFKEIYIEDTTGNRWLLDHNARPIQPWPLEREADADEASGSAADLDGDGNLDLVISRTAFQPRNHGIVEALDRGGNIIFSYGDDLGGASWPPAIADIDGDCAPEIVINDTNNFLDVIDATGQLFPGWPVDLSPRRSHNRVAVGDVDGDGRDDIVFTDMTPDVKVHGTGAREIARYETDDELMSAYPALGDIDGDGELEIVAINFFGHRVYAWNRDGSYAGGDLSEWPVHVPDAPLNDPALGDIDGDGMPEILAVSWDGSLHAWNHDGTPVDGNGDGIVDFPVDFDLEWQMWVGNVVPIIADIDGKAGMEILVMSWDSRLHAFHHDGTPVEGFPMDMPEGTEPQIAVSDIDGDGWRSELVVARENELRIYETDGRAEDIEWGSRNHDHRNTRNYNFTAGPCVPVNNPPVFDHVENQPAWVNELLTFTVTATDPDDDELTYSAERLPRGANFEPDEARFTWTPDDDQWREAPYRVRFAVEDGRGGEDSMFVLITVESDNRPPIFDPLPPQPAQEGEELIFVLTANDPDGDELTYSAPYLPDDAGLDPVSGEFTWTPALEQGRNDPYLIKFFVHDGRGGWDLLIVSITVANTMNSPPIFNPKTVTVRSVTAGERLTFTIEATDPDGDEVSYEDLSIPPGANFDGRRGIFSWQPGENQVGKYIAQFLATDGRGGEDRLSVRIVVMPPFQRM